MKNYHLPAVLAISLIIAVSLAIATFKINFWPTDSELAYIPAATQVFSTPFLSDLHHATFFQYNIMHGKEALVVAIAIVQRLTNDYESLFPNILVLILAATGSGLLIFLILRKWLDEHTAFWGFLFYATTFWTYQYVIQGAHQPLVMFNFLLTTYAIFKFDGRRRSCFYAGLALGLMLFSSPTAVVYAPYLIAAYFFVLNQSQPKPLIEQLKPSAWIFLGTALIILIFTLPDPAANWRAFMAFVKDCQKANHFYVISRLTGESLPTRGVGIEWIIKYFTLIMPILFGAYLTALVYLIREAFKKPLLWIIIAVSLSTPIGVEIIQVAQFGRNYFSWLIGILLACAYALYHFEHLPSTTARQRTGWRRLIVIVFLIHLGFNAWAFLGDVLPSRMAATHIYNWFNTHPGSRSTYLLHPHNINTSNVINRPGTKNPVLFDRINSIKDAQGKYMFVPMMTGKSIYLNCGSPDYTVDPELNRLISSGQLGRYVVASFPTMASSQFWPQEEEYCSYLDLIQGRITDRDRRLGYAWILDAEKLRKEWFNNDK